MAASEVEKLTDNARSALKAFLGNRPNIVLPSHLAKLEGVHGIYVGDGRPLREIVLGWKPAFVVFTVPGWPDGPPQPTKDGGYFRPPLHDQPPYTDRGFTVTEKFNASGALHLYVVWKSA
jgi:hypothetical protein